MQQREAERSKACAKEIETVLRYAMDEENTTDAAASAVITQKQLQQKR